MKLTIERLRKVLQLPASERVILVRAWGLFLLVDLALRILPFKHLVALCQHAPLGKRAAPTSAGAPSVARLVWLVEIAGRYAPVSDTCLKKALVLSWLLGRRGIPTELQIGVARDNGRLTAHAWVDYGGEAILGHQEIERYERLVRTS